MQENRAVATHASPSSPRRSATPQPILTPHCWPRWSGVGDAAEKRFYCGEVDSNDVLGDIALRFVRLRVRRGFLDYSSMDVEQYQRERLAAFVAMLQHMKMVRPPVA